MILAGKNITCSNCMVWSRNPKAGTSNGQCRRFPPALLRTDHGLKAMHPVTDADHWCGEHLHDDGEAG